MPQNPVQSTLFVSRIKAGLGIILSAAFGTGIVTIGLGVPYCQTKTQNLTTGIVPVANMSGAAICYLVNSNATPGNQTTPTAAALFAAIPGAQVGYCYTIRLVNTGAGTWTWVADASITLTGTATVATNITRDYCVTFTSATAATMQSVGSGVSP